MTGRKEVVVTIVVFLIAVAAILVYFNNGAGTLEIKINDQPNLGEATQVYLNCSAIEIHRAQADNQSGWVKVIDKSDWINLTTTLDVERTICYANLQAGTYNLIRFKVLEAYVTVNGTNRTASILDKELITQIPDDIKVTTGQTATLLMEINVKIEDPKTKDSLTLIPEVEVAKT